MRGLPLFETEGNEPARGGDCTFHGDVEAVAGGAQGVAGRAAVGPFVLVGDVLDLQGLAIIFFSFSSFW